MPSIPGFGKCEPVKPPTQASVIPRPFEPVITPTQAIVPPRASSSPESLWFSQLAEDQVSGRLSPSRLYFSGPPMVMAGLWGILESSPKPRLSPKPRQPRLSELATTPTQTSVLPLPFESGTTPTQATVQWAWYLVTPVRHT
ncbi:Hypothetical predicted protein [Pelobates cultripes]|uniref:Uncharacterized protein n=1 Tax=Pelobates cultripes TaxID=61616 RepID=A0AAD1R1J1_PELCU|nr:Hypothetical predicted protein [Pelobates cultripes]